MVSASAVAGFSASVNVAISGLPPGVSASPAAFRVTPGNPPQPVTLTATSPATVGAAIVGFVGTSGSVINTASVDVNVTPAPDFSISIAPTTINLLAGGAQQQVAVSINALYGFTGTANVTLTGLPAGVTATGSVSIAAGTTQNFLLTAPPGTAAASTTLSFQAVSGSITHSSTEALNVSPAPNLTNSVSIPQSMRTGTTAPMTVSASSVNGSKGSVTVTIQILQGTLSGVTGNPLTFTLTPNSTFPTVSQTVMLSVPGNAIPSSQVNSSDNGFLVNVSFSNEPNNPFVYATVNVTQGNTNAIPPGAANAGPQPVTVTTSNSGASNSVTPGFGLYYIPQPVLFPLADILQEGIFDGTRSLYYFSGQNKVEVFSLASGIWLAPITLPGVNSATRLMGISLSPDGSKLAVADAGNKLIYVLDPSTSAGAQSFPVLPQTTAGGSQTPAPGAVAVTNAGVIYYSSEGVAPLTNLHKLDSATGVTTDYPGLP